MGFDSSVFDFGVIRYKLYVIFTCMLEVEVRMENISSYYQLKLKYLIRNWFMFTSSSSLMIKILD